MTSDNGGVKGCPTPTACTFHGECLSPSPSPVDNAGEAPVDGEVERLREALRQIASGEAFCEQRFAEDDDAEYFLRVQRRVSAEARAALSEQEGKPPSRMEEASPVTVDEVARALWLDAANFPDKEAAWERMADFDKEPYYSGARAAIAAIAASPVTVEEATIRRLQAVVDGKVVPWDVFMADVKDALAALKEGQSRRRRGWGMSAPCPWCEAKDHWSGRVEMCPSRAARMVAGALENLIEPGESWQAYALRLRKQLSDEAERVP